MMNKHLNRIIYLVFLCFVVQADINDLYAQCMGPKNNGEPFIIDISDDDDMVNFVVGGFNVSIYYDMSEDKVFINASGGTMFHTNGSGIVVNLNAGTNLNTLTPYELGPAMLFNLNTNTGPFGGGNSGYIGMRNGGRYGWIYLEECGQTICEDYRVTVLECRFDELASSSVVTGDCTNPIPTLSQWGIMILGLCLLIMGTIYIKQREWNFIIKRHQIR